MTGSDLAMLNQWMYEEEADERAKAAEWEQRERGCMATEELHSVAREKHDEAGQVLCPPSQCPLRTICSTMPLSDCPKWDARCCGVHSAGGHSTVAAGGHSGGADGGVADHWAGARAL